MLRTIRIPFSMQIRHRAASRRCSPLTVGKQMCAWCRNMSTTTTTKDVQGQGLSCEKLRGPDQWRATVPQTLYDANWHARCTCAGVQHVDEDCGECVRNYVGRTNRDTICKNSSPSHTAHPSSVRTSPVGTRQCLQDRRNQVKRQPKWHR